MHPPVQLKRLKLCRDEKGDLLKQLIEENKEAVEWKGLLDISLKEEDLLKRRIKELEQQLDGLSQERAA